MPFKHQIVEVRVVRTVTYESASPDFDLEAACRLYPQNTLVVKDGKEKLLEITTNHGLVYLRSDGSLTTRHIRDYATALIAITMATFQVRQIPTTMPPYVYPMPLHESPYEQSAVRILGVVAQCHFGHEIDIPRFLAKNAKSSIAVEQDAVSFWLNDYQFVRLRIHSDGRGMIVLTSGWRGVWTMHEDVQIFADQCVKLITPYRYTPSNPSNPPAGAEHAVPMDAASVQIASASSS